MNEKILRIFHEEFAGLSERLEALGVALSERSTGDELAEAFRVVHTLKGDCQALGFDGMAQLAHQFEDLLRKIKVSGQPPVPAVGELLLEANDQFRVMITDPQSPVPQQLLDRITYFVPGEVPQPPPELHPSLVLEPAPPIDVRAGETEQGKPRLSVEVAALDALFSVSEALRGQLDERGIRELARRAEDIGRGLLAMRQTSAEKLVPKLRRTVNETARRLAKPLKFTVLGETIQANASVVNDLSVLLPHMLRNAIDHGLESPAVRHENGKPLEGSVIMRFRQEAGAFVVQVADDGRGMDPDTILACAVKRGLVSAEGGAALTDYEKLQLIFAAGFSTSASVSEVSGRGVGMDIVASAVKRHRGRIEIETSLGQGTTFELRFPVLFRWEEYLITEVGDRAVGFPVRSVAAIVPLGVAPSPRDGMVFLEAEALPLIGVASLDPDFGKEIPRPLLILDLAGARTAFAVDRLRGFTGALIQALPGRYAPTYFAGLGKTEDGGEFWGIDLDEVARDWNAFTVPYEGSEDCLSQNS